MRLDLKRTVLFPDTTIGALYVDGAFECYILEDQIRVDPDPSTPQNEAKVPGQTAIPPGTYKLGFHDSPRFKRRLLILLDVPGCSYILMHPGNKKEDTDGCLLPGNGAGPGPVVTESVKAHDAMFKKVAAVMDAGVDCFITVSNLPK